MDATMMKDDDLREKIKTFIVKLDKMEARVKEVETVTATLPKLEAKLQKMEARVESAEQSVKDKVPTAGRSHTPSSSTPAPLKAFLGGASIGLLILGLIAVWFGLI